MKNNSNQLTKYLSTFPFYKKKILCKAPFNSLRLTLNGNIQVCCVNTEFVLGKYPDISIKEAWFGKKINQFRDAILEKNLSLGCSECNTQIEIGAFSSLKAYSYNHIKINKNRYPSLIEFELANNCNLECVMCNPYTSSAIQNNCNLNINYSTPYNISIVNEIEEFIPHLTHVNFIGGEPFLIPIYYSIIEKILSINNKIRFNISTNGTILNDKVKNILKKGQFDISVSVDSIKKETYETIRKNANFDMLMENLRFFNDYCKKNKTFFSIMVCPIKQNAFEMPELIKYFDNKNVPVFFNTVFMPHSISLTNLNSSEIKSIYTYYLQNKLNSKIGNDNRFNDLINLLKSWENNAINREINEKILNCLNFDELKDKYFSDALKFLENNNYNNVQINNFKNKTNNIILNKDSKIKVNILRFLLQIPIKNSVEMILANNEEYINYYISKNF